MYKVVDVYGKEAVVQVDQYNRGDVLRKACTEMYGNWNVDMMLQHFRITPVRQYEPGVYILAIKKPLVTGASSANVFG